MEPRAPGRWTLYEYEKGSQKRRQCPAKGLNKPENSAPDGSGQNPSVWTDYMLETLESGVKGGKWFNLLDKV